MLYITLFVINNYGSTIYITGRYTFQIRFHISGTPRVNYSNDMNISGKLYMRFIWNTCPEHAHFRRVFILFPGASSKPWMVDCIAPLFSFALLDGGRWGTCVNGGDNDECTNTLLYINIRFVSSLFSFQSMWRLCVSVCMSVSTSLMYNLRGPPFI